MLTWDSEKRRKEAAASSVDLFNFVPKNWITVLSSLSTWMASKSLRKHTSGRIYENVFQGGLTEEKYTSWVMAQQPMAWNSRLNKKNWQACDTCIQMRGKGREREGRGKIKEEGGEGGGGGGAESQCLSLCALSHCDQLPHSAAIMPFLPGTLYYQTMSQISPCSCWLSEVPATSKTPDASIFCMLLVLWGCVTTQSHICESDPIIRIAAEEIDARRC